MNEIYPKPVVDYIKIFSAEGTFEPVECLMAKVDGIMFDIVPLFNDNSGELGIEIIDRDSGVFILEVNLSSFESLKSLCYPDDERYDVILNMIHEQLLLMGGADFIKKIDSEYKKIFPEELKDRKLPKSVDKACCALYDLTGSKNS